MNSRPVDTTQILTLRECAQYLRVHYTTVCRLAHAGKIPCFKVGSDWRFMRDELQRWMKEQEAKP